MEQGVVRWWVIETVWGPQLKTHSSEIAGCWGQPPFQRHPERWPSEEPGEMGQDISFSKLPVSMEDWNPRVGCSMYMRPGLEPCKGLWPHSMEKHVLQRTTMRYCQLPVSTNIWLTHTGHQSQGPLGVSLSTKGPVRAATCFTWRWWE